MHGITAIAFVGSVFSPYYAWARRGGSADPENHCALNIALYGPRSSRWAMTERGKSKVAREPSALSIGPSVIRWIDNALEISVNEVCAPLPRPLRGVIRLMPSSLCDQSFALDAAGRHRWTPYAPAARVQVAMNNPALSWSGTGYFDSNSGDAPLEDAFERWTWSRASLRKRTIVLYDTKPRDSAPRSLALRFERDGEAHPIPTPSEVALPRTRWQLTRHTRVDAGHEARVIKTLEDAPFYSRSLLETGLLGTRMLGIHESLSLDRFQSRWVQCLLPFRMPRIVF